MLLCHLWALSSWVSWKYQWLSVGHFAISLHCRKTPQRCLLWALCSESCTRHRHLCVSECVFFNGYASQGFSGKRLGLEISSLSPCWALMSRCQLLGRAGSDRLVLVIRSLCLVPGPNSWSGWMAYICLRAETSFDACLKTIAKHDSWNSCLPVLTLHLLTSSTLLSPEQWRHRRAVHVSF